MTDGEKAEELSRKLREQGYELRIYPIDAGGHKCSGRLPLRSLVWAVSFFLSLAIILVTYLK
jgi:hypothetical protein